jgi:hypothetical protein
MMMWFARISLTGNAIELPFAARAQAGERGDEAWQTLSMRHFDSEHFFYVPGAKKRQLLTLRGRKVWHQPSGGCTNGFVPV